jgi:hypothetical protein
MSSIISEASQAIQIWNEVRNNPVAIINYFNQGSYFQIIKEDYLVWKANSPEFIHAYLGLVQNPAQQNFSLTLFSVDSVIDKKPVESNWTDFETNLKQNPYKTNLIENATIGRVLPDAEIPLMEGLMRTVQWSLHKDKWMSQQEDLVQVFEIPFTDLSALFDEKEADYIILCPSLKEQETSNTFKVDLILWGYNIEGVTWNSPMDLIRPRPPFKSPSSYQLLSYAL